MITEDPALRHARSSVITEGETISDRRERTGTARRVTTAPSRSTSRSRCSAATSTTRCRSSSGRALPDVRDGLKPVHLRILYAMYDGGYRPDRGYFKCARVVGDVMGSYHPHGDTRDLRHPGPAGPAVGDADAAGRRQGQLRLAGQRPGRRDAVHRVPAGPAGHGDAAGHRQGDRRLPAELRRPVRRSRWSCPAGSRTCWSTAREGIAVGMATKIPPHNLREVADGRAVVPGQLRRHRRGAARGADRADQGPGLPDRRGPDRRPPRHRGGLPHRPRLDHHARGGRGRGGPQGPHLPGRHRAALPGQPGQPGARRSPSWSRTAGSRASPTCATRPATGPASASSSCSSATPSPRSC